MRTQLLCTFVNKKDLNSVISLIIECYDVVFDKIYVFENNEDPNQLFCTYNVVPDDFDFAQSKDTISLHRKKQTNTLYTINALNEIIRSENNGVLDKSFTIEWENFQNTLLLTNENGLQKIITKIHTVVNTRNWEESHFNR
jgi:hypothetical protein|tara:strand:- start:162 stop:584 length:423 start_codon:yes stop_codon:yes gene_type:complete